MRKGIPNFDRLNGDVVLKTDIGVFDLHNFAHFREYTYKTTGHLHLVWDFISVNGHRDRMHPTLKRLILRFFEIGVFEVTARDPEIPWSRDQTLNDIYETEDSSKINLRFEFHGGYQIRLGAESSEVEIYE